MKGYWSIWGLSGHLEALRYFSELEQLRSLEAEAKAPLVRTRKKPATVKGYQKHNLSLDRMISKASTTTCSLTPLHAEGRDTKA